MAAMFATAFANLFTVTNLLLMNQRHEGARIPCFSANISVISNLHTINGQQNIIKLKQLLVNFVDIHDSDASLRFISNSRL